jgi:hypothetical protein
MSTVNLAMNLNEHYSDYKLQKTSSDHFDGSSDKFVADHEMDVVFYVQKPADVTIFCLQSVDADCSPKIWQILDTAAEIGGIFGPLPLKAGEEVFPTSQSGSAGTKTIIARVYRDGRKS